MAVVHHTSNVCQRRRLMVMAAMVLPLLVAAPLGAWSAPAERTAPETVVGLFNATLLRIMQGAGRLGYQRRYDELSAVMHRAFDFSEMARIATGPAWAGFTAAEQEAVMQAFCRFSIATYVSEFNDYSGEEFEMAGRRDMPQGAMVSAKMTRPGQTAVTFGYLLHEVAGAWRIIDVYLEGTISQLAVRRSEFSSILARAGADGLVQRLAEKTRQLEQGATS